MAAISRRFSRSLARIRPGWLDLEGVPPHQPRPLHEASARSADRAPSGHNAGPDDRRWVVGRRVIPAGRGGRPDAVAGAAGLYGGGCGGYGTAVGEAVTTAGAVHGFPAVRTSFIGRAGPVHEVAVLLERYRLVTVTGPGGSGKTRLAGEVARQVAGRFEDGVWLVELALVQDPEQVPAVVAAALGVREQPGVPAAVTLARVLARQQLLLVLDNCEHVISAAGGLCAELVAACDELRVLATSREALQVAGEARYRLGPLAVPDPDDLADAAKAEAVMLFADRARQADAHFVLDGRTGPQVARLDGMPLAIELAAARVEALGVGQLLDRRDDRFALLAGGDRLAPSRQRSLAAAVEWSYQLLDEPERRAFRAVSVFPGPFTLDGAEAVAGAGAGLAVLRLVDCSLLAPPRAGVDGQPRYVMLDTLRAYGAKLRDETGEQDTAAAALAGYALRVAEEAGAGLQTSSGEGSRGPAAGCRGPRHAPGSGLGLGARPGYRAPAGSRAGAMVVPARPAGRPVPTAVRDSRTRRGGERGGGAPPKCGLAGLRCPRRSWSGRWATSLRSSTPQGTRGRPGCWPMPWPAGRRPC